MSWPNAKVHPASSSPGATLVNLRIRSLISDKEMVVATANRDLQCFGGWSCGYDEWHRQIDGEIRLLLDAAHQKEEA